MPVMKMNPEEIRILRKTLKMSEAELADRIELEDRQLVKQLESGAMKASPRMNKLLLKLLTGGAARSPKLKKVLEALKERSEEHWRIK
jgi:DNA-binding transcriptional regulator YiaG